MVTTEKKTTESAPDLLTTLRKAEALIHAEATRLQRIYGSNSFYGFPEEKASQKAHADTAESLSKLRAAFENATEQPHAAFAAASGIGGA